MSATPRAGSPFPRAPLLIGFTLIAVALSAAAYRTWISPHAPAALPDSPVLAARALRFEDAPSGQVVVIDAATGATIEHLDVGTNGFLRATMRGLARGRAAVTAGAETPFLVERRANGQLLLIDPATARFIDLRAFGPTNSAVFARYLNPQESLQELSKEARL
jgi:putative photosynthetic complex assembly protein